MRLRPLRFNLCRRIISTPTARCPRRQSTLPLVNSLTLYIIVSLLSLTGVKCKQHFCTDIVIKFERILSAPTIVSAATANLSF